MLTGPILWMNGTDHLMPQPWLGRVVAEANELLTGDERADDDDGYELRIASLSEHVRSAPTEGLPAWTGELRSEEHTSELQSLMRISYAVFCLKKKKQQTSATN